MKITRRTLAKFFGAASAIATVKSVETLDAKPGDVIIVKCDEYLTLNEAQRVKDRWNEIVKGSSAEGVKTVVIGHGMDIKVLRQAS